jgi:predicted ATPase
VNAVARLREGLARHQGEPADEHLRDGLIQRFEFPRAERATVIERLFVLTDGRGSGKSTLVGALEQAGYARSVEAGRGITEDQVAIGGQALPWCNAARFRRDGAVLRNALLPYGHGQTGPVFFDRGVPDAVGYLRMLGLPVPRHMEKTRL